MVLIIVVFVLLEKTNCERETHSLDQKSKKNRKIEREMHSLDQKSKKK